MPIQFTLDQRKNIFLALLAVPFLVLFNDIILPFLVGFFIAWVFFPLSSNLKKILADWVVALICMTLVVIISAFLFFLIIPVVNHHLDLFSKIIPHDLSELQVWADKVTGNLRSWFPFLKIPETQGQWVEQISEFQNDLIVIITNAMTHFFKGSLSIIGQIFQMSITLLVTFFMIKDFESLRDRFMELVPQGYTRTIYVISRRIRRILDKFVRGQLLVCLILGLLYTIALTILGVEYSFALGLISGLLIFIPYLGSILGFVITMVAVIAQQHAMETIVIVAAVYIIGQLLEGNIITPKIVGESVGLHALWVIFALMAGEALFGLFGMMIALPMAATTKVILEFAYKKWIRDHSRNKI